MNFSKFEATEKKKKNENNSQNVVALVNGL